MLHSIVNQTLTTSKKRIMHKIFFVILLSILCFSCTDDDKNNGLEISILETYVYSATTPFQDQKDYPADSGAKVFVYYGYVTADFLHYQYLGNGILKKESDLYAGEEYIFPNLGDKVGRDGVSRLVLNPENPKEPFTVITESGIYSPDFYWDSFGSVPPYQKISVFFSYEK